MNYPHDVVITILNYKINLNGSKFESYTKNDLFNHSNEVIDYTDKFLTKQILEIY